MRWLLRLLLFWAISAPLFYLFGMPYMLDLLSKKAQAQTYAQCQQQLRDQGLVGSKNASLHEQQGVGYCHCMSDGLVMTKADLMDALHRRPPAALTAMAQARTDTCNVDLRRALGYQPPAPAAPPTAAPQDDMIPL
jgi:hypothetical protein